MTISPGPVRNSLISYFYPEVIDAGNSSDIYSCVNIARDVGLDIRDMLRRIVVSRPFTIYQLAGLVIDELPDALRKFDTKLIIISDMIRMFLNDPRVTVRIGIDEARSLVKDITDSLRRRFKDVSIIVLCYYLVLYEIMKLYEIMLASIASSELGLLPGHSAKMVDILQRFCDLSGVELLQLKICST